MMGTISTSILVLGILSGKVFASPRQCNADNCLRAIEHNGAAGISACSSFQTCTVTPPPVAVTTTVTATTRSPAIIFSSDFTTIVQTRTVYSTLTTGKITTPPPPPARRDVAKTKAPITTGPSSPAATTSCPSALPTWASACLGTARFASACSCLGVTKTTTTLSGPVTTVTSTVTTTLPATTETRYFPHYTTQTFVDVTTVGPPEPPPGGVGPFQLLVAAPSSKFNNYDIWFYANSTDRSYFEAIQPNLQPPSIVFLDYHRRLFHRFVYDNSQQYISYQDPGVDGEPIYMAEPDIVAASPNAFPALTCAIVSDSAAAGQNKLQCTNAAGGSATGLCVSDNPFESPTVYVGKKLPTNCEPITLRVIYHT